MAPRGTVGIEEFRGKYRLRLPRGICEGGKQVYLSTGLEVNPTNLRKVRMKALEIEDDIASDRLDTTLERYKFRPQIQIARSPGQALKLLDLWDSYTDFMKPQVSVTTYLTDYKKLYRKRIQNLPTQDHTQAAQIRNHLVTTLSGDASKRTLQYLNACCNWALTSGLIDKNPFDGITEGVTRRLKGRDEIDPFSVLERDSILTAFENDRSHHYYFPFVKFLFLTGCRPGEAIALTWEDVASNLKSINICKSYNVKIRILKSTKTDKPRRFPVNQELRDLLADHKPPGVAGSRLIFPQRDGGYLNNTCFTNQIWRGRTAGRKVYRGIMPDLIEKGLVERYRPPYNCRHTFITQCVEAGVPLNQVAYIVGNSPEAIVKHYLGRVASIQVPELF